jgi:hypothetical protein
VPEFTEKAVLLLIGAAATGLIGGIGFLLKRRFARHASDEVEKFIAHHERLLSAQSHTSQPQTSQEQARLDNAIHELHPGVGFQNMLGVDQPNLSQAEIGMHAAQEADAATLVVRQIVERLEYRLNDEQRAVLREAQATWERHADLQSRLAAAAFEGGTIMPTIYHSERTALARERAVALKRVSDSFSL